MDRNKNNIKDMNTTTFNGKVSHEFVTGEKGYGRKK